MSSSSLCGSCSVTFTLFKRKNRCSACRMLYCSSCFKKGQHLPQRNLKHCLKCHALSSEPFIASELMLLTIRELKAFLHEKNVPVTGCKEKRDLVEVIINHQTPGQRSSSDNFSQRSASSQPHTSTSTSSNNDSLPNQSSSSVSFSTHNHSTVPLPEEFAGLLETLSGLSHNSHGNNVTAINPEHPGFLHTIFAMNENGIGGRQPQGHAGCTTTTNPNQGQKSPSSMHLEDCTDSNEIKKLSVKELKALLDENFVDYKGCCEKDELVQRALMLWESKKVQGNAFDGDGENMGENDLCKICMDKTVDCVLLECGHLVTCIDCGKRLRECPMCRQNISRIVRVFKS